MFTSGFEKVANTKCDQDKIKAIGGEKKKHEKKESKKHEEKEHKNKKRDHDDEGDHEYR